MPQITRPPHASLVHPLVSFVAINVSLQTRNAISADSQVYFSVRQSSLTRSCTVADDAGKMAFAHQFPNPGA